MHLLTWEGFGLIGYVPNIVYAECTFECVCVCVRKRRCAAYHVGEHGQDEVGDGDVGGELGDELRDEHDDEQHERVRQAAQPLQGAADHRRQPRRLAALRQREPAAYHITSHHITISLSSPTETLLYPSLFITNKIYQFPFVLL
jgi:hypothetical protein